MALFNNGVSNNELPEEYSNFCSAPWCTISPQPDGSVEPCCISTKESRGSLIPVYGNLNDKTFNEITTGEKINEFRKKFLRNERPEECNICWKQEETSGKTNISLRNVFNKHYFDRKFIDNTNEDGSFNDFKIRYWDLRPSNRCNFSCIICCEQLSSGYWQLQEDMKHRHQIPNKFTELTPERFNEVFDVMKNTLDEIHPEMHFYFAGGEPLMMPEHKHILDYIVEKEYYDVSLRYNTNLSTLKFKGTNWADVWSKFTDIDINCSIDAAGLAGEFQRTGSNWKQIKQNLLELKNKNIRVTFNMVMTMWTYPVVLQTLDELEEIFGNTETLHHGIQFVATTHPEHMAIDMIPDQYMDTSIVDQVLDRGYYRAQELKTYIQNADHTPNREYWRRLVGYVDRLEKARGITPDSFLPWYRDYVNKNWRTTIA